MRQTIRCGSALILLAALALGSGKLLAQSDYPSRPVRIVVAAAVGGPMDIVARMLSQKLGEVWKQPVLVDNRGGAGGTIGADVAAKAAPDGYTLLHSTSALPISPSMYRKLPYDALKDFAPLSRLVSSVLTLVVNSSAGSGSVMELIAHAKSQPGRINYGSSGVGNGTHLSVELFKMMTGTEIVHVPYKGNAPTAAALLANEVQMLLGPLGVVMPHIRSGKLRALAVSGGARLPALPDVPTMVEAGVPNYEFSDWQGLFAPAGTPREILGRFQAEIARAIALPDIRERLIGMGYEPVASTPEEFDARYKADIAKFARIIKEARITQQD